jgi:hypothetical protein
MAGLNEKTYLSFLKSGQYSDFTISCGNVKFQVHRIVICSESDMLTAACNGNFKVNFDGQKLLPPAPPAFFQMLTRFVFHAWQEAADAQIDLSEENPSIISRVLLFLYTSEYNASKLPEFVEQW